MYDFWRGGVTAVHRLKFSFTFSFASLLPVLAAFILVVLLPLQLDAQTQWTLAWSDEFIGTAGTGPDLNNWSYDSPTAGASNNELEIYCGQAGAGQTGDCSNWLKNAYADGSGNLVIAAVLMPDGQWTSARILTHGHFTFTYGRAEARIKLPSAAGLWPAYWMLGDNIFSGTKWPNCGEEDMMENVPSLGPTVIQSSLNGPGYNGGGSIHAQYNFPAGQRIDTDYHVYGVIWGPDLVQYYVDDYTHPFASFTPANMPRRGTWEFNGHSFFMLLNLAVGGSWPGPPDASTPNPANMYVDYVRVYQGVPGNPSNLSAQAVSKTQINLSWTASASSGVTYNVYQSRTNGFLPSTANQIGAGVAGTSFTANSLNAHTVYYFRVVAVNGAGSSLASNQATATTPAH
jgi:beta-glucanase (GH16 family)